jgi:hypothetical protein
MPSTSLGHPLACCLAAKNLCWLSSRPGDHLTVADIEQKCDADDVAIPELNVKAVGAMQKGECSRNAMPARQIVALLRRTAVRVDPAAA